MTFHNLIIIIFSKMLKITKTIIKYNNKKCIVFNIRILLP